MGVSLNLERGQRRDTIINRGRGYLLSIIERHSLEAEYERLTSRDYADRVLADRRLRLVPVKNIGLGLLVDHAGRTELSGLPNSIVVRDP